MRCYLLATAITLYICTRWLDVAGLGLIPKIETSDSKLNKEANKIKWRVTRESAPRC